jgi:sulfite reductase beta subunit-like hemoprotein
MANGSTKYTGVRENNRLILYCETHEFFLSFSETVTEPEILAILKPMIKRYALERTDGERFGDFVIRAGYISPTTSGKAWYDGMGGEGQYRET